jgi:hypothetical protein
MPLVLTIALLAWAAVAFLVVALCRFAARGDRALHGERTRRRLAHHASHAVAVVPPTARAARRASAGHRRLTRRAPIS